MSSPVASVGARGRVAAQTLAQRMIHRARALHDERFAMTMIGDYEARVLDASGGVVRYEATHRVLPRRAIIEVIADSAPRASAVRLLRHACILEALRGAAVPRVFECGRLEGQPWVAFEAIDGRPLDTELEARALEVDEVFDVLEQVGATLSHAHARGVLHRDVTPRAIIRERTGNRIVLAGWANTCTLDTEPAQPSPPPHRDKGPHATHTRATDVYGLGMTALQSLAGPNPTLATQPRVPRGLTLLLADMVSDDPGKRPTADALAAAVRSLRTDKPAAPAALPGHDPSLEVELEYVVDVLDEPVLLDQLRIKPRWTPQHAIDVTTVVDATSNEPRRQRQ
jgi:serine/threonine protein kinase